MNLLTAKALTGRGGLLKYFLLNCKSSHHAVTCVKRLWKEIGHRFSDPPLSLSRLVFFSSIDTDLLFLFQSHFLPFMKVTHPERECIYDWLGVPEREGKIYNKKSQIKHREIIMN